MREGVVLRASPAALLAASMLTAVLAIACAGTPLPRSTASSVDAVASLQAAHSWVGRHTRADRTDRRRDAPYHPLLLRHRIVVRVRHHARRRAYPLSADEVRDGADIVDWIIAQPWSVGVVGATGTSYDGTLAVALLRNRHPAVKAIAPRFSGWDVYTDIFLPGGINASGLLRQWSELTAALDHPTAAFSPTHPHRSRALSRSPATRSCGCM